MQVLVGCSSLTEATTPVSIYVGIPMTVDMVHAREIERRMIVVRLLKSSVKAMIE